MPIYKFANGMITFREYSVFYRKKTELRQNSNLVTNGSYNQYFYYIRIISFK